jgi:hypothetical protein
VAAAAAERDRFGIGWRREIAAELSRHLERVDVVEVIAEDWLDAPRRAVEALAWLAQSVPVALHGVALGPVSSEPVNERVLARTARLMERVPCVSWSEHLAFVRGGDREIGHLAAAPRTPASVAATCANLERARKIVGRAPLVENVATLIDPPLSDMDEAEWIGACLRSSGCRLLLDLHNLHANATNFGYDARASLASIPIERVEQVHIAGGRWIRAGAGRRLLDDHQHDVPDPVFALLEELGTRARQPLTVILERDGRFGPIEGLLGELERARQALTRGRARAAQSIEVHA